MSTNVPSEPPGKPVPPRAPAEGARRFRDLPPWVNAWTAVIGVGIGTLGLIFTAFQILGPRPTPSAVAQTPFVIMPEAYILEVTTGGGEVAAKGRFRFVDVDAEVILLIGRPAGGDARWVPVEANVVATAPGSTGIRVDGDWRALRPFSEEGRITWRALVVPAGSGAADGYEDIKVKGPDSSLVLAASDEYQTGP